jgi:hypothetical protein
VLGIVVLQGLKKNVRLIKIEDSGQAVDKGQLDA